jgi:hypothetical protein
MGFALAAASNRQATQAAPTGLPPGFRADLYVTGLHTPRFVAFSPDGDLHVAKFRLATINSPPNRALRACSRIAPPLPGAQAA